MSYLTTLLIGIGAGLAVAQTPTTDADERLLRDHSIPTDNAGLLAHFRIRTLSPEQLGQLKAKLKKLGSPKFSTRTQASAELVKAGLNARGLLLDMIQNPEADRETARRAELCVRQIDEGQEIALSRAAARLLAERKPSEAAAVLIRYIPFAADPQILDAVQETLNAVTVRNGQADAAVLDAVRDPHAGKRAAAGVALIRAGGLAQKPAVAHLLKDQALKVRVGVTVALVEVKDKDAVPFLIERLEDANQEQLWQIADLLERVAGDKAPAVYPGGKIAPAQVRAAWQQWWTANSGMVDLAKLTEAPPHLGYKLLTFMSTKAGNQGTVVELKPDGTTHFEINNLQYPVDARVIGPNRLLIAEYLGRKVSERDFQGNILWEVPMTMPLACQRLPGGDTFIATRKQLLIVDHDKKTTFSYQQTVGNISAAHRTRDGQMVVVGTTGQCHWLDSAGNEIRSFPVGYVYTLGGNIEVLPNRHLLVPQYRDGKVAEFDADGKMVWSAAVPNPVSATRLPNGHVLVATFNQRVLELNRQGETVWSYQTDGRAWRARGR